MTVLDNKYFKSIYLRKYYVMFAYLSCSYGYYSINFDLYKIDLSNPSVSIYPKVYYNNIGNYYKYMIQLIYPNGFLSDFIKISDVKLVFIITNYCSYVRRNLMESNKLLIKIIELKKDYTDYTISEKTFD